MFLKANLGHCIAVDVYVELRSLLPYMYISVWRKGAQKTEAGSSKRQWIQTAIQKVFSKHQEAILHHFGAKALEKVAQRGVESPCWKSSKADWLLVVLGNLLWCSCLSTGMEQVDQEDPANSTMLWFYELQHYSQGKGSFPSYYFSLSLFKLNLF